MIPIGQDEILSCFAAILAVLWIIINYIQQLNVKSFIPGRQDSSFVLCRDEVFSCNRFNPLKRDEKVI